MNPPLPKTPEEKMRAALSWYSSSILAAPGDSTARKEWETGLEAVFGPVPVTPDTHEATTKVLCNAVRAALSPSAMIRSPRVNVLLVFNVALLWVLSLLFIGKLWSHEYLRRTKAEIRIEQLERQLKHAETLVAIDPRQP